MKKFTASQLKKVEQLKRKAEQLQSEIYDFASKLEDQGKELQSEVISNAGFELDAVIFILEREII